MTERLLTKAQVAELTTLSNSEIDRREKAGKFPKKIQVSAGRVAWIGSEIDAWVQATIKTARGNE